MSTGLSGLYKNTKGAKEAERERLIELIQNAVNGCARNWAEVIADCLISAGVIAPPYKVDDTVYVIADNLCWKAIVRSVWYRKSKWEEDDLVAVEYGDGEIKSYYGREIYFTEEEAEQQALQAQRAVSLVDGHIEE